MPTLDRDAINRLHRQLRRAERGEFDRVPRPGQKPIPRDAPPRVVMLLEDCASGDRAECAILVEVESTETQIIEIMGTPVSGTFKLTFSGQTTGPIAYDATAETVQAALESLSNIHSGDVVVEIGPGASVGARKIYRWLVSFTGQYVGEDVAALSASAITVSDGSNDLEILVRSLPDVEDTGETLDVLCVTPLPEAVVIPAGAIGVALPIPTFGYCLITAECSGCGIEEAY